MRKRGSRRRKTVKFCPVCVVTAYLVYKQFMHLEGGFNANISQNLHDVSLSKKLTHDGENNLSKTSTGLNCSLVSLRE